MNFINSLADEILEDYNESVTENGAIGYRTTGKSLLDLNFAVSSLRSEPDETVVRMFSKAFFDDKILAMKWLFFARDVRGGLGERRLFRTVMEYVADAEPWFVEQVIPLVSEYGRFDDLLCLLDHPSVSKRVADYIGYLLRKDISGYNSGKEISLLAKWLPSVNASSKETKRYAKTLCKALGMKEKEYRQTLSMLRKYLDVVEVKMSSNQWGEINYETVPSRANLVYQHAFLRNDADRRLDFLNKLENGEAKINASVLYPHDIVHKYSSPYSWDKNIMKYDASLEALWKALPDMVNGCGNTIVVADGSFSMNCRVGDSDITAHEVANALAIYFAERSSGLFKDKYITFSMRPQLVDLKGGDSLRDKLEIAMMYRECANTNIEAVFSLILNTAIDNNMKQEDLPANILIISDMEFDEGASCYSENLFKDLDEKYRLAGYKMPRLVFWNTCSRTRTIPIKENELGVALVSGFSVNICKMVMSNKTDPFECLIETLNDERYKPIEAAIEHAHTMVN